MSVYPTALDSDEDINRVDEGTTETLGNVSNQIRDAIFNIEGELGLGLSGSKATLAERLDVLLNPNGSLKASALINLGLVTLPISDIHVGSNAAIKETKLALDYSTSNLNTRIISHKLLLDSVKLLSEKTLADFLAHLAGTKFLASDGTISARHVASHIDLNIVSGDDRDANYSWTGLLDKLGNIRSATQVAEALLQINNDLVSHENSESEAHLAVAITVDPSEFNEIPKTVTDVQKLADYLDDSEVLNLGQHRAVQHAAGIPKIARSSSLVDGYNKIIVPKTLVNTYRQHSPANSPVDSNLFGDDIIEFKPNNSGFLFDSQFKQVKPGDTLKIDYGNGISTKFLVESKRFIPNSEWVIRINGINLFEVFDGYDGYAYASIEESSYDTNTYGVLALAAANSIPSSLYPEILGSIIVGDPKGAMALGLGFDPNQINSNHYNLYLQLYPTGNPEDLIINLPAIDITGNLGQTPGAYNLQNIIHQTNNSFRKVGYNYRFIAFEYNGDFGIMLADSINNVGFSINNSGLNNVIGIDGFDALGFGDAHAAVASPAYQATFADATAAMSPTIIHLPAKHRNYIVNGQRLDGFAPTYLANDDGYWSATINAKVSTGSSVEVTYKINLDLCAAGLAPGKTLVVQPSIKLDDPNYITNDYGRFVIKDVAFIGNCGDESAYTTITVINGVHATGTAIAFTSGVNFPVQIYFSQDSVGFNDTNVITAAFAGNDYHRFHEIYVDDTGNTFSHERSRLIVQNETATLLATSFWHIKEVSAKLKGYADDVLSQSRYVRFYVTRFDSDSGEYDGYIGQRDSVSANIYKTGPLTTGRKNVTTRFYNENYIDYIDLEFDELSAGPGSSILSTAAPRYVDIEIFSSLRLQDELLLLGSCEVNWEALSNQNIIQYVKSLRQFGSIDEMDFTESAVDFINSVDKAVHENGIIKGFEFLSTAVTTGELFYSGGEALVDGRSVVTNAGSVTIPQISSGGNVPALVTWAVCVNKNGYLVPILITSAKDQFFAGASNYYVPSVTFSELISSRRDLTPISIVTAAIASITINKDNVADVRRFISRIGLSQELIIDNISGHFKKLDSAFSWIKNYEVTGSKLKVKIKGEFTLTESLDLSLLTSPVEIEGDNAVINVNCDKGILIDSNISFKNINFNYNPTNTIVYTAGDYVNRSNGCIYFDELDSDSENIVIDNCQFICSLAQTQRPPFIIFRIAKGNVVENVRIKDNTFIDTNGTEDMTAIAFIGAISGGSTNPSVLANSVIEHNIGSDRQGIYITSLATTSGTGTALIRTFAAPGIKTQNVNVKFNSMGTIGFLTSGRDHLTSVADGYQADSSLHIDSNTALFIGLADATGQSTTGFAPSSQVINFGTGNVTITKNNAANIFVNSRNETSADIYSSAIITENNLKSFISSYLTSRYNIYSNYAIFVSGLSTDQSSCVISNNTIDKRKVGPTDVYYYTSGIYAARSAIIANNIIKGVNNPLQGTGIGLLPTLNSAHTFIVTGNSIYRQGLEFGAAGAYIKNFSSTATDSFAIIKNNYFDSLYIDAANTIIGSIRNGNNLTYPSWWKVEGNKNHTKTAIVRANIGMTGVQAGSSVGPTAVVNLFGNEDTTVADVNLQVRYASTETFKVTIIPSATALVASWLIPLADILPIGAVIVSVTTTAKGTDLAATTRTAVMSLQDINNSVTETVTSVTAVGLPLVLNSTDFTVGTYVIAPEANTTLKIDFSMNNADSFQMSVDQLLITYHE